VKPDREHEREAAWLTEECEFSLTEVAEISGLTESELREFVEYGAIAPVDPAAAPWSFTGRSLITVRAACRLRADFELEPHGVALVVSLLDRIGELQSELARLQAQLPRRR
jgi:chaperone modulatory protein CbpM